MRVQGRDVAYRRSPGQAASLAGPTADETGIVATLTGPLAVLHGAEETPDELAVTRPCGVRAAT
ncbi:hypothetical protein [Streptomyces sp. 900105755]